MSFGYSEQILQWIWQEQILSGKTLRTVSGKPIQVLNPGTLNQTDGPDFLGAHIRMGNLDFHGAIELHIKPQDWYAHGHHKDPKYNQVVLHVYVSEPFEVQTHNGSIPNELDLRNAIDPEFVQFLNAYFSPATLPCSNSFSFISEKVFADQLTKAAKEYFEEKSNAILQYYNPGKPPLKAWKEALVISLFDGFGISHNRQPMCEVAKWMLQNSRWRTPDEVVEDAYRFVQQSILSWNKKSVRPNNRPEVRLKQASVLAQVIMNVPEDSLFNINITEQWNEWLDMAGLPHSHRTKILFGTVILPANYVLGSLFQYASLQEQSFRCWMNYEAPVPRFITSQLSEIPGSKKELYQKNLGSVFQIRHYCKPRRCSDCEVLKKAIIS